MAFSHSIKMVMVVTLLIVVIFYHVHAQINPMEEELNKYFEQNPGAKEQYEAMQKQQQMRNQCPPEYLDLYKECKGTLKTCSDCLSDAERDCDRAVRVARANGVMVSGTCSACTTNFAGRCDSAERMCFGYQECGGGNNHCVNFKCQYEP